MSSIFTALTVGLVAGLCEFTTYGFSKAMFGRPLVIGPAIGLVLGDLRMGIIIGATIELIYLGSIPIGAAIPANAAAATSISTALAILAGLDVAEATVIAVPVAVLAQLTQMLVWTLNAGILHMADKVAETGDIDKTARLHYLGMGLWAIQSFLPTFLAVLFGVGAIEWLINLLNNELPFIINGFKIASSILPALGFGMLYNMMDTKNFKIYFVIGFILAAFFSGSLISVSALGVCAALMHVKDMERREKRAVDKGGT